MNMNDRLSALVKIAQYASANRTGGYDFNGELLKLMKPLSKEYKANKGAYKVNDVDMVQQLSRDMRAKMNEMRNNPGNYNDDAKRRLIEDYKRKVEGIRGRARSLPKTYGRDAGWQPIMPGISIIPRTDRRYAHQDKSLVQKYNGRFLKSLGAAPSIYNGDSLDDIVAAAKKRMYGESSPRQMNNPYDYNNMVARNYW